MACLAVLAVGAAAQQVDGLERVPEAARETLLQNGFVVAGECRQIYSPYVEPEDPVFVTTDAIAHGYAMALRALVRRMDRVAVTELRGFAARLAERAGRSGADEVREIAGLGYLLGGGDLDELGIGRDARTRIENAAERLRRPEASSFSFAGVKLSPAMFRPVAGYDADEELQSAWRVRTLWSELGLRLERPRTVAIAYELCKVVAADPELLRRAEELAAPFDELLGPPDDPDLRLGAEVAAAVDDADEFAARLLQLRRAEVDDGPPVLRVFGARRTPGGVTLLRAGQARRDVPSGVDLLLFGPLRSKAGGRAWRAHHGAEPISAGLHDAEPEDAGPGQHGDMLRTLQRLTGRPGEWAPDWMRAGPWRDKQCWTQLGGWAEVRHAFALHAERPWIQLMRADRRAGVVAPYPEFFAAIAALADRVAERVLGWECRRPAVFARGQRLLRAAAEGGAGEDADLARRRLRDAVWRWGLLAESERPSVTDSWKMPASLRATAEVVFEEATREQLEILRLVAGGPLDPVVRMRDLAALARTCARLAEESWGESELPEADRAFLLGFGKELAFVCGSPAVFFPPDDAPVVVTVATFRDPRFGRARDQSLQVGVGRPERLWALVPVGDRQVLHEGAVLSYREARVPLGRGEFQDETWRKAAQAGTLPEPPAFTRSFRVGR